MSHPDLSPPAPMASDARAPVTTVPIEETPSAQEQAVLEAIDATMRLLTTLDDDLAREVARQQEARRQIGLAHYPGRLAVELPLKSERQETIEAERRAAKLRLSTLIDSLCEGRMYRRGQIIATAARDGMAPLGTAEAQGAAIAQADLWTAAASVENEYARRAFWHRYKHRRDDDEIAAIIGTVPRSINTLVNIALDHIDHHLNEPIVALVRARFANYLLAHGLEFPEYSRLRGR